MAAPGYYWYEVPSKADPEDIQTPDFGSNPPTGPWHCQSVGTWPDDIVWYVLVQETLTGFSDLSDEQVSAAGIEPNRTMTGA